MDQELDNLPLTESIAPSDQEAVTGVVQRAWRDGTPLYPLGGGTRLSLGARPNEPGLGLSLAGLKRVVDYPARDLTITVEAGLTIAELAERLAGQAQRLPVDVPHPARATVGGAVAVNAAGPRQLRWGTMRDYVIGIRAVDGTGTAFGGGGRVVKNAAGYDLCRLLTGSLGTLGVVVQVTLMVKPMPETSAFVACQVPDGSAAEDLLALLIQTRTLPTAVELLTGPAWQDNPVGWVSDPSADDRSSHGRVGDPSYPLHLAVGLEGSLAEVEWMIAQLQEEWRQAGIAATSTVAGKRADPVWDRLTEFAAGPASRDCLAVRIHVLPAAVAGLVQRLRTLDPQVSIQAHAANGVVNARLSVAAGESAAMVNDRLRPEVDSAGGHMIVLARPAGAELGVEGLFGPAPEGWAVMQSIRRQFDPKGILNRGRFLLAPPAP